MGISGNMRGEHARAEPRIRVLLVAELRTETSRVTCRDVDLSRGGACLELDSTVAPGRGVTLHSDAMQTRGKVIWLDGGRCGVRFDSPIRATQLLVQMSQSRKSQIVPELFPFTAAASAPSASS